MRHEVKCLCKIKGNFYDNLVSVKRPADVKEDLHNCVHRTATGQEAVLPVRCPDGERLADTEVCHYSLERLAHFGSERDRPVIAPDAWVIDLGDGHNVRGKPLVGY